MKRMESVNNRILLPHPCLLHHFSAQTSRGFVVTSSSHLGLFVFFSPNFGLPEAQIQLTQFGMNFLEGKATIFVSCALRKTEGPVLEECPGSFVTYL